MIKSGYLLEITTWENDGDSYATKSFDGLSYADCTFLVKVAKLFHSCHSWNKTPGYGNGDTSNTDVYDAYRKLAEAHIAEFGVLPEAHGEFTENDYISDVLYDLIGNWYDGEYWRVVETYRVHFVPSDLLEVTDKFQ